MARLQVFVVADYLACFTPQQSAFTSKAYLKMIKQLSVCGFLCACLYFGVAPSSAQIRDENNLNNQKTASSQKDLKELQADRLTLDIPALEKAIDPATYIVGPGDRFYINISQDWQGGVETVVTAEGKLVLPTLGIIMANGKTLAQVQKEVEAAGEKQYLKTKIYASLMDLRFFRVHVLGEVALPGIYPLRQTYRLSDAIGLAGGTTVWANLSAIEIRRDGAVAQHVELDRYTTYGELESNPLLQDGDIVFVPRATADMPMVRVEGRVAFYGIHFVKPNETAAEFLQRMPGASRKVDLQSAVIKRLLPGNNGSTLIPLYTGMDGDTSHSARSDAATVLRDGDTISIPLINDSVYVQGAVYRPGPFPYHVNFLASDYAGLAGPTENAVGLNAIRVRHADTGLIDKGPDLPVKPGDTVEVKSATRKTYLEYLQILGVVMTQINSFILIRQAIRNN